MIDVVSSLRLSCSSDEEILYRLGFFGGRGSAFTSWRQRAGCSLKRRDSDWRPNGQVMWKLTARSPPM